VLGSVIEGKDLKDSLVTEGKAGLKNLLEKAANNLDSQKGKGFDFKRYHKDGQPAIGKIKKRRKHINKMQSSIGPPTFLPNKSKGRKKRSIKRLRVDSLGTY
jgi:hypothetical protein